MKKILLAMSAIVCTSGSMMAQQKHNLITPVGGEVKNTISNFPSKDKFKNEHKKTRGGSLYLSYLDFVAVQEGISQTTIDANSGLYSMFPDSAMRYNPPYQGYGIQYKSIGQVLDPSANVIKNNLAAGDPYISTTNAYTLDSVFVLGSYAKLSSAVDTLIVSIVHSGGQNLPVYYYTGQTADFGVDTTRFCDMLYPASQFNIGPYQSNVTGAPAAYTFKHVLTNADSSDHQMGENSYGLKYLGFSANSFAVPAGEKVAVSFTFKPGFTYAAGDTIGNNNQYLFMSTEPNGDNTFIPFYAGDYNQSEIITKDSSNGYSGAYIPTVAFSDTYGPEMHNVIFKVTCPTCWSVGVNEVNNFAAITALPNPANDEVKFSINLNQSASNVTVELTNTLGQVVKTINLGSMNANFNHTSTLNVTDLATGLYIYTVNADGQKISNKLMIK